MKPQFLIDKVASATKRDLFKEFNIFVLALELEPWA